MKRLAFLFACITALAAHAEDLDDLVARLMREKQIVGLSLAIIEDGKIVKAQGYGLADKSSNKPVTTATLFQAGSISKPVAALAALRLVEQGRLSLDDDVNRKLRAWKVPENEFTKEKKVTLRGILSHSAGLTVHGFPGYSVDSDLPTLVEVLDGAKPANTPPIRVDLVPGSQSRYSGGGYVVAQQMIIDVTGQPFPKFMAATVLKPLGMTNSTYEQPLPTEVASKTATGYHVLGWPVKGRWHVYPEMSAAGLWTTAPDLARFAISIQESLAGKSNPVISQSMTRQMLARQKNDTGLGLFLQGEGKNLIFMHGGQDEGFHAEMVASANNGTGVVVMTNANRESGACKEIIDTIVKEHHWW